MSWAYKFQDHTADIAVDVEADSLAELFMSAASAWREVVSDIKTEDDYQEKLITLVDKDLDILLVSFLSELNFLFQSENWLMNSIKKIEFKKFDDNWNLMAKIGGGIFDHHKYKIKSEIKAVTYHQMEIKESNGKFSTRIVFDI